MVQHGMCKGLNREFVMFVRVQRLTKGQSCVLRAYFVVTAIHFLKVYPLRTFL